MKMLASRCLLLHFVKIEAEAPLDILQSSDSGDGDVADSTNTSQQTS